ncbi:MAG: hypothetical protein KAT05_11720 [Spirochaetes bacterium]|nr:hypothetical protein [Spirochaetota bacterium]
MTDKETFLLKEYEQLFTVYNSSTERRYSLLKLYFLIVALPISIFSIISDFMIQNNVIFAILFLLIISVSGFLIFNSLISIHITKVIYAKSLNKIRGYFVENDATNIIRKYIILPINEDKPLFLLHGSLFYDCMLISIINSMIFGISLYILLIYFGISITILNAFVFLLIPLFIIHYICYNNRLKKQDTLWKVKREIEEKYNKTASQELLLNQRKGKHMNNEQNDCPLSSKEWIIFLNGEISNLENDGYRNFNNVFPVVALFITALAIITGAIFSTANSSLQQDVKNNIFISITYGYNVLSILFFIFCVIFIYYIIQLIVKKKKADKLKMIRNNIIDGSLDNTNEIRERWSNVMNSTYIEVLRELLKI